MVVSLNRYDLHNTGSCTVFDKPVVYTTAQSFSGESLCRKGRRFEVRHRPNTAPLSLPRRRLPLNGHELNFKFGAPTLLTTIVPSPG